MKDVERLIACRAAIELARGWLGQLEDRKLADDLGDTLAHAARAAELAQQEKQAAAEPPEGGIRRDDDEMFGQAMGSVVN